MGMFSSDEKEWLEAPVVKHGILKAKSEVAREIFDEIDSMCIDLFGNFNHNRFIELKKKYTGE